MKKLLLIAATVCFSAGVQAQTRTAAEPSLKPEMEHQITGKGIPAGAATRTTGSYWINYSDEIEYYIHGLGGGFPNPPVRARTMLPIFPDTTIILGHTSTGEPFAPWIHSVATMIAPNNLPSQWIAPGVNYRIDSMEMVYAYVRNTDPSIVDTLVLSFIKHDNSLLYTIDPSGEAWEYQDILWDTINKVVHPSGVLQTVRIPLTEADSTVYDHATGNFSLKIFGHEFNPPVANLMDKRFGVVVDFRPGYTWTPFVNGNPNADSLLGKNSFWILSYEENGDPDGNGTPPTNYGYSHNMSYVIDFRSLFNAWTNGWNGYYLPTPYWGNAFPYEHHAIYFKATSDQVGINEVKNSLGMVASYPNPASDAVAIGVDLIESANDVTVYVTDILGREVARRNVGHWSAGVHSVSFDTNNWSNGLYNCTISAGGKAASVKITVAH